MGNKSSIEAAQEKRQNDPDDKGLKRKQINEEVQNIGFSSPV